MGIFLINNHKWGQAASIPLAGAILSSVISTEEMGNKNL